MKPIVLYIYALKITIGLFIDPIIIALNLFVILILWVIKIQQNNLSPIEKIYIRSVKDNNHNTNFLSIKTIIVGLQYNIIQDHCRLANWSYVSMFQY